MSGQEFEQAVPEVEGDPGGEPWQGPSPEEWEATQDKLAIHEELYRFEEQEALLEGRSASLAELQEALLAGDPGALEAMQQMQAEMIDSATAPLREWQQSQEVASRLSAAEVESQALIAGHLERLEAKDVDPGEVWARSNELLRTAQKDAAANPDLSDAERAWYFDREAALMALRVAAEDVVYHGRPLGNVPNAVTARFFGLNRPSPSEPKPSGLGNVPGALTHKWFGRAV